MHIRLIGDTHDVTGFSLAGVESEECHTRAELVEALESARRDPELAILVVTPQLAALADDLIRDMRDGPHLPITIVLPSEVPA